jgi:ASPIC and UnbV.
LLIGLGTEKLADTVRITWPNGLIQNEIKQPARKQARYEEAQRLSGSCPNIWTWNGREFEYITDVLGVARWAPARAMENTSPWITTSTSRFRASLCSR